jgi:hypothetical protein
MRQFQFHPELLETCTNVRRVLDGNDIVWFRDFASVDAIHDDYGVEVCGIKNPTVAGRVLTILTQLLPALPYRVCYLDDQKIDPGWVVELSKRDSIFYED